MTKRKLYHRQGRAILFVGVAKLISPLTATPLKIKKTPIQIEFFRFTVSRYRTISCYKIFRRSRMTTRLLIVANFLFSASITGHLHADAPWTITDSYPIALTGNAVERLTTEYYRPGQWNVISTLTNQYHDAYFYPTFNDQNPAGVHVMDAHKVGLGDFNGDGRQDVIISWATFPHVVEKPARPRTDPNPTSLRKRIRTSLQNEACHPIALPAIHSAGWVAWAPRAQQ